MMKFNMMLILPTMFNFMMILIMMMPSKISKFHPISLMMILIMLNFLICLKINFIQKSIISFILFLIMIGGLMVIFMYITSLANNELFSFNFKFLLMNMIKILPLTMILLTMSSLMSQLMINNLTESFQIYNLISSNYMNFNIMYKELNNKSSYFIMLYLYYSMICIMNICYKLKIPLRQLLF